MWELIKRATPRGRRQAEYEYEKLVAEELARERRKWAKLESHYQYNTLSSPTQFRLLKLHAKSDDNSPFHIFERRATNLDVEHLRQDRATRFSNRLVCSLETFDLDGAECPAFEALSYEWNAKRSGPGRSSSRIIVTRRGDIMGSVRIGANLNDLLAHVREKEDDCYVWADAICINQGSQIERGHQVKLMGRIYSQAYRVLSWLPLVGTWHTMATDFQRFLEWRAGDSPFRNSHCGNSGGLVRLRLGNSHPQILELSYWTRKWIIQEVILARTVVLAFGEYEFAMHDLEDALARHGPTEILSSLPVARLAAHRRNRRLKNEYPWTLQQLLPLYQDNQCGDPMDHVYALYNLVGEHRTHLEVDYKQQPGEWIVSVLQFIHRHEQPSESTMFNLTLMLKRLAGLSDQDLRPTLAYSAMRVAATAIDRGAMMLKEECASSIAIRRCVRSLSAGAQWNLEWPSSNLHPLLGVQRFEGESPLEPISSRVLSYFEIPDRQLCGLAAISLQEGDRIWQFFNTTLLGFVVRFDEAGQQLRIVGRCYVVCMDDPGEASRTAPRIWGEQEKVNAVLTSELLFATLDRAGEARTYTLLFTIPDLMILVNSTICIEPQHIQNSLNAAPYHQYFQTEMGAVRLRVKENFIDPGEFQSLPNESTTAQGASTWPSDIHAYGSSQYGLSMYGGRVTMPAMPSSIHAHWFFTSKPLRGRIRARARESFYMPARSSIRVDVSSQTMRIIGGGSFNMLARPSSNHTYGASQPNGTIYRGPGSMPGRTMP